MANTRYTVEQAINRAYQIQANHPHYSMEQRGSSITSPYHDCSSFVGTAWDVPGRPATPSMKSVYMANGFDYYDYGSVALQRGDVVVYNGPSGGAGADGHTAMYIGNGQLIEMSGSADGVRVGPFYDMGWQQILRGSNGVYIKSWNCTSNPSESFGV